MNTGFILMAQYSGQAIIPRDMVCKDHVTHLTTDMFQHKSWLDRSKSQSRGWSRAKKAQKYPHY
ncbi:Pyocin activator protein PrtN [Pseudomonas sp. NFACC48-1]|nr:Pyocin activator protein PrtN [Pseudomonas sp. NFACC44-2]SDA40236.1 Pyocin activator protein PrtN [Pseudomonas sp. NFACC51]SEI60449.1 Pyocin activator protein PrtN [Pseudomonas sp. NFACC07-1]SFH49777.1 Pyocin activator protein PrtN [Pseudomonas sp. NFACC54]SFT01881.1 Pyocin activator protein PrtN [Pseudomonas sp. NFACC48-1]